MKDITKTTLRYESDIEKLLQDSLETYNFKTINGLVNHLIKLALIENPKEIEGLKNEIKRLNDELRQKEKSNSYVKSRFNQLKVLVQDKKRINDSIDSFLHNEPIDDGRSGAYSQLASEFFSVNKLSYTRKDLNLFSEYLYENKIEAPSSEDFKTFKRTIQ